MLHSCYRHYTWFEVVQSPRVRCIIPSRQTAARLEVLEPQTFALRVRKLCRCVFGRHDNQGCVCFDCHRLSDIFPSFQPSATTEVCLRPTRRPERQRVMSFRRTSEASHNDLIPVSFFDAEDRSPCGPTRANRKLTWISLRSALSGLCLALGCASSRQRTRRGPSKTGGACRIILFLRLSSVSVRRRGLERVATGVSRRSRNRWAPYASFVLLYFAQGDDKAMRTSCRPAIYAAGLEPAPLASMPFDRPVEVER